MDHSAAQSLDRRSFIIRTSAQVLTISALDVLLAGRAPALAQDPVPEDCPSFHPQLQQLVESVDLQIAGNCLATNRLTCPFLLTAGQLSSFAGQLSVLDGQLTDFSCQVTSSDAELIALSDANTALPGLVTLFQGQGFSARQVVCSSTPGIPTVHPFGLLLLGSALLGVSLWWLRRRRGELDSSAALPLAIAAGPVLLASPAQAQAVQLVDVLEQVLGNRCLARLLAVPLQTIVPVNEAIQLGQALNQVKNNPAVAAELTGLINSLDTMRSLLIDFSVGEAKDRATEIMGKFIQLVSVSIQLNEVQAPARTFVRALGKRTIKCLGSALLVVDIARGYAADWNAIQAEC